MASSVSTVGAVKLNLGGCNSVISVPTATFFGKNLRKVTCRAISPNIPSRKFKVVSEVDEGKQTGKDRWKGLVYDVSDDQQDITRGKGMVDTLFQAPMGTGTHDAVLSSYEYISQGLRQYNFDNSMNGYYIAPAFMDKLVVHIAKNFMNLPNIKVPLILGIWGGKGQGKSFQCELVFAKMGINPIMMSAGELESGNAGEPAKLIRQRYREAADRIAKGKLCVLFINDLDAGAGRMGGTTQYTVNNQMVNATLMNIADNPTNVQLPGMYNQQENPRVPIIVTGNDFSTLYAPLIRDGRMEKFYWAPTREDRIGVCTGIFRTDNVPREDIVKLVDTFPGQSIDFFGAIRARVYDDEVRNWISSVGVENIGKRLVNSKEGPPTFDQPKMTLDKLLEYGNMLVQEQENVKRVQLADKYLNEAALGDANEDSIKNGSFYGKAAQEVHIPVPEGCTDPNATNFDPTARSDDGSCTTMYTPDEGVEESQSIPKAEESPTQEVESNTPNEGVEEPTSVLKPEESPELKPEVESNTTNEGVKEPESLLKAEESPEQEVESNTPNEGVEEPESVLKAEESSEPKVESRVEEPESVIKAEKSPEQEVESDTSLQDLTTLAYLLLRYLKAVGLKMIQG